MFQNAKYYNLIGETDVVDDNLVDTKNRDDCQATTEETPVGMEFRAKEGRTEF